MICKEMIDKNKQLLVLQIQHLKAEIVPLKICFNWTFISKFPSWKTFFENIEVKLTRAELKQILKFMNKYFCKSQWLNMQNLECYSDQTETFITPAHFTASLGDFDTLEIIHKLGINMNERDSYGRTPLHYALGHGRLNSIENTSKF